MNKKMDAKKILVSLFAIASILLLAASASAYTTTGIADTVTVKVNGVSVDETGVNDISVLAGDIVTLTVEFTGNVSAESNVRIKAELEGNEGDVTTVTPYFDVKDNKTYVKTLTIKIPSVDKDLLSEDMDLNLKIWNSNDETVLPKITLSAQRDAYTAKVVSVNVDSSLNAGEVFPVEVMLKNTGYNTLEDVYVTVKISTLGIQKTVYFGDIVDVVTATAIGHDEDDVDTVSGKVYLTLPFDVTEGKYTLEVVVKNDDTTVTETKEIFVANGFPNEVMKVANGLFLINPSTELRMYKIVTPSDETIVSVQAGTSKTVDVKATSAEYTVTVLKMNGEVVGTFTFDGSSSGQLIVNGSPVVVLTAILAVVFLILVVVLVVLMTKKPKKSEDSESYY
jgi:hypothetical protein